MATWQAYGGIEEVPGLIRYQLDVFDGPPQVYEARPLQAPTVVQLHGEQQRV